MYRKKKKCHQITIVTMVTCDQLWNFQFFYLSTLLHLFIFIYSWKFPNLQNSCRNTKYPSPTRATEPQHPCHSALAKSGGVTRYSGVSWPLPRHHCYPQAIPVVRSKSVFRHDPMSLVSKINPC